MAVRVRSDGSIVCAAMHEAQPGDCYLDDVVHYRLSVELGVLVSEPHEKHGLDGFWWWHDRIPLDRSPSPFYEEVRRSHVGVTGSADD